ncbi:NlpC/P60 family protein [Streptomyces sp. LP11]|uniref:NlpC/P60 family protein n=1 Tax=Streptomyces pyxinicus TaxID=2970331 RepID=A0ABT2B293_9ACTN|nr:NlpC/P60 family protein [Streptomyces sp. LP11]MCS0602648.1 NlpC/P60 family protein [Streptomyces sp. LP11]
MAPENRDEVRRRIASLYDRAEDATGNFNATRAMAGRSRSRGVPLAKRRGDGADPSLDELTRRWFDAARAGLGPTVPAVLPADRRPLPAPAASRDTAPAAGPRALEPGLRETLALESGPHETSALESGPRVPPALEPGAREPLALPSAERPALESGLSVPPPEPERGTDRAGRGSMRALPSGGPSPAPESGPTPALESGPTASPIAATTPQPSATVTTPLTGTAFAGPPVPLTPLPMPRVLSGRPSPVLSKDGNRSRLAAAQALFDRHTARLALSDTGSVILPAVPPRSPYASRAARAVAFARAQVGKPCVWGATGPGSYDCSSLTRAAWKAAGVTLPRAAHRQALAGTPVTLAELEPGDLVVFFDDDRHVGLHIGDGMMVHAPGPGSTIREESVFGAGETAIHRIVRPS